MGFKMNNLNELRNDLQRMNNIQTDGILENAAKPVLSQMKQNASSDPKRQSGDLYNALSANIKKRKSGSKVTIGVHRKDWKNEEYYPAYVEYGHAGPQPAPAHPFVRPAFDTKKDEAYQMIRNGLNSEIRK